jgi:valyl-tRNA synthetase
MPFITEELWHVLRAKVKADAWPDSILAASYPRPGPIDEAAERGFGPVIGIVDAIRNVRGEMNIPFKVVLEDVEIGSLDREVAATVREELGRVHRMANVKDARLHADGAAPSRRPQSAVAVGAGFEVRVGLAGAVDLAAESARIDKEIAKLEQDLSSIEKKLANPSFVAKAPPEVVEKDRARADELREKRGKLEAHRAMLSGTVSPGVDPGRRERMENENQNPSQGSSTQQTAVETAQQIATTAAEVGKAAAAAVVSGVEGILEKVMPDKKGAARRTAKKAPAKKAAAKKTAKKAVKKAAKKVARKTAGKAKKAAKGKKR